MTDQYHQHPHQGSPAPSLNSVDMSSPTNGNNNDNTQTDNSNPYQYQQQQQQQQQYQQQQQHPYYNDQYSTTLHQPSQQSYQQSNQGLRNRRTPNYYSTTTNGNNNNDNKYNKSTTKGGFRPSHLDMFPKVERDMTVKTEGGGTLTLIGYVLIVVLSLAELGSWLNQNGETLEHVKVDTSLNKRMRVNLNITFPSLHCDDLHVDAMDVAGDSQLDVEDTLIKTRLYLSGEPVATSQIKAETNAKSIEDAKRQSLLKSKLPKDYCGSCYGASQDEGQCCDTCDDVIAAYKKKRWNAISVQPMAEQCIREGRTRSEPKRMTKGEGCNLSGYMFFNRVAGNFHIAMGEGVERDGRHIHQFVPEDAPNFNASHYIHRLTFGDVEDQSDFMVVVEEEEEEEETTLNGVKKVVTDENGETGLFQYFIKIVPTTYKDTNHQTNRYFFTERFRPLMSEMLDDAHHRMGEAKNTAGAHAGGKTGTSHHHDDHHKVQNAVLPGVFFVYEICPFAVEVKRNEVPFSHLLIRVLATVGGVITIMGWADGFVYARDKQKSSTAGSSGGLGGGLY